MPERRQVLECLHCGEKVTLDDDSAALDAQLSSFMAAHIGHEGADRTSLVVSWVTSSVARTTAPR